MKIALTTQGKVKVKQYIKMYSLLNLFADEIDPEDHLIPHLNPEGFALEILTEMMEQDCEHDDKGNPLVDYENIDLEHFQSLSDEHRDLIEPYLKIKLT